jgi:Domain of unknown function (DUF4412)
MEMRPLPQKARYVCRCLLCLVLISFGLPPWAEAGWRIVAITKPLASPSPLGSSAHIETAVSQNRIKYETQTWEQIVNLRTQRLALINHMRQTYWEGPIDEYLAAATGQAMEVRTQRDKLIQRLPPEQRMIMEKRGGPFDISAATLEVTVTPAPEEETVVGYKARKYTILRNGEPYEETWITEDINLSTEVDRRQLQEFIEKLQASRTTPPGVVLAELTDLIADGYPIRTVNLLSNVTKELIRAEKGDIPDEEFAAPKGYTQRTLTDVMALPQVRTR